MARSTRYLVTATAILLSFSGAAIAQKAKGKGRVIVPKSNVEAVADVGLRAHTNMTVFVPEGYTPQAGSAPFAGYFYETPASAACLYGLVPVTTPDCNPNVVTANPTGGDGAIAIVDAYDDPTAAADLEYFSAQFGLAKPHFEVIYANGTQPPQDPTGDWELEESLDIEWAHAMAPGAKIYLVEAASNYDSDLLAAELVAADLVRRHGGGEVTNSWGGGEFPDEVLYDVYFSTPGVVYFASSGDGPGVIWPSTSPNVVAAGGTSISRNPFTGSFIAETAWEETGGGVSEFETRPDYQDGIASIIGKARGVPDVSFDANPNTGVWVYDSTPFEGFSGWWIVGGTSVSSPALAGIVNSAGNFHRSSHSELATIYKHLGNRHVFNDTTLGYCGPYAGYWTSKGWDPCTGVGSVNGKNGK